MRYTQAKYFFLTFLGVVLLTSCTVAKLEARLEANPQCKDVINPKTGAVMPCPGSDKSFYRSVGLEPPKPTSVSAAAIATPAATNSSPSQGAASSISNSGSATVTTAPVATVSPAPDCKPQIHKKTGGMLPCPAPD
jgi:hypothetical protein